MKTKLKKKFNTIKVMGLNRRSSHFVGYDIKMPSHTRTHTRIEECYLAVSLQAVGVRRMGGQ